MVADVNDTSSTVDGIRSAGGTAEGMSADATSGEHLAAIVSAAEAAFGPIEILVNNARLFADIKLRPSGKSMTMNETPPCA